MTTSHINWESIQTCLKELILGQQNQLLQCGRRLIPNLTPEDLLQPNDFNELEFHPIFRYEEGILAGMQTVQMALQALNSEIYH